MAGAIEVRDSEEVTSRRSVTLCSGREKWQHNHQHRHFRTERFDRSCAAASERAPAPVAGTRSWLRMNWSWMQQVSAHCWAGCSSAMKTIAPPAGAGGQRRTNDQPRWIAE